MARARRNRKKGKAPAKIGSSPLDELLGADVGDGLMIEGQTYAIASVGRSEGGEGFATREYTLGEEEDLYLVVEGHLASGDPGRSRAVKTHELSLNEVLCPGGSGRNSTGVSRAPAIGRPARGGCLSGTFLQVLPASRCLLLRREAGMRPGQLGL